MLPVKQTRLKENGNCFEACIASLLNLKLEGVPDLLAYDQGPWMEKLNEWLNIKYNLVYMEVHMPSNEVENFFLNKDFYHVIIGNTTRSPEIKHAVIGRKGKMVYDPHPSNIGVIKSDILYIGILVSRCANFV